MEKLQDKTEELKKGLQDKSKGGQYYEQLKEIVRVLGMSYGQIIEEDSFRKVVMRKIQELVQFRESFYDNLRVMNIKMSSIESNICSKL